MLEAARQRGLVPPQGLAAYVESDDWDEPIRRAGELLGIPVAFDRLPIVLNAPVDLLDGRASGMKAAMARLDWRLWRVPVALAAACVVAALVGLNLHWGRLAAEKSSLREAMVRTYRAAFPGTGVIVDPALQMRRNVGTQRAQGGRSGPEDFVPMFATFAQAIGPQGEEGLAAVEYRDGKLKVRFNPATVNRGNAREQLRQACARLGLKLQFDNERDPTAVVSVQGA
jgi:type II secretion system protein L